MTNDLPAHPSTTKETLMTTPVEDTRQRIYDVLTTFYGLPESVTADQRDHIASMTRAVFAEAVEPELERLRKELADTRQAYDRTFARMCEIETDDPAPPTATP